MSFDLAKAYREIHQQQESVNVARARANLAILRATTIPFEYRNGGDVVLLRNKAYPSTDFWPSTNKWLTGSKYMLGDANALVDYLKRRALK